MSNSMTKKRARDLGLPMPGTPGRYNAITDVEGVLIGFETLSSRSDPALATNGLPVQTGVTAILPRGNDPTPRPVFAGIHALNGNGEMTAELGLEPDDSGFGSGSRSQRFTMIIEDGKVTDLNIEEGPDVDVSSAETMMALL